MRRITYIVMLGMFLTPACSDHNGSAERDIFAQVEKYITSEMRRENVKALSIALVDGQEVIWSKGFGYADPPNRIKANADTFYEIGSCSKTITALGVMTLVEHKRLDLDVAIQTYLSQFSIKQAHPESGPITLRTILTHHSGIPGDIYDGAFDYVYHPDAFQRIIELLKGDYTAYPTNFVWAYSNTGVTMEGPVIEKVTGEDFVVFGDRLLRQMGMAESSWLPRSSFADRKAKGYYQEVELPDLYINIMPAGSVNSSVLEIAEYIKVMLAYGNGIVGSEMIEEMLTRQNEDVPLDLDLKMGLAWVVGDPALDYAGRLCWHTGGSMGYTSRIEILMDHQLGAVVLTNAGHGSEVTTNVIHELLIAALAAKTGIQPPPTPKPAYSPPANWSLEQLQGVAGVYVTRYGYDLFEVSEDEKGLNWLRWEPPSDETYISGHKSPVYLIPRENGFFSTPDSQVTQVEFAMLSERDVAVIHKNGQRGLLGERFELPDGASVWKQRCGTYTVTDLPSDNLVWDLPQALKYKAITFEMTEKDHLLLIQTRDSWGKFDLVLEPLNDETARIVGLVTGHGEIVQIQQTTQGEQILYRGNHYQRETQPEA